MNYQHRLNGERLDLPLGKIVCIGRNYADHAKELNNPIPTEPLLFIKPTTALVDMEQPFSIPSHRGVCHFETEMALLIGQRLSNTSEDGVLTAIMGVGLGFDLTLRQVQDELKAKGQPWEKAKAFDGSCPVSGFVSAEGVDWENVEIEMRRNGTLTQKGNSANMLTPVKKMLSHMSEHFSLMPGDIVMTGTPAGVGPLEDGDQLVAELRGLISVETSVK